MKPTKIVRLLRGMDDYTFRKPNYEELRQLADYLIVVEKVEVEDLDFELSTAFIAVLDNYTTFYPGYAGKVMLVVWGIGPHECDTFIWSADGKNTMLPGSSYGPEPEDPSLAMMMKEWEASVNG